MSTAPAKEHEVYNELLKVKEIVELHPLFGEYDLIAKIEAEDFNILGQVVVDKIRSIAGVIDTKTLTGIKFSGEHMAFSAFDPLTFLTILLLTFALFLLITGAFTAYICS